VSYKRAKAKAAKNGQRRKVTEGRICEEKGRERAVAVAMPSAITMP